MSIHGNVNITKPKDSCFDFNACEEELTHFYITRAFDIKNIIYHILSIRQEIIRKDDKIIKLGALVVMKMNLMYNTVDWLAKANTARENIE